MKNTFPLSRKESLVVQNLDNEVLIYDLTNNKALCLNQTSAIVWQLCDGKNSVAKISQELSKELNSKSNEDLVWFALEQLKKEKLLAEENELPQMFAGMSRREVIKKVGLGTMVALPIVASIVAPTSAMAQSGCFSAMGAFSVAFPNTTENCGGPSQPARNVICQNNVCSGASLNCVNNGPPNPSCSGGAGGLILTCTCSPA